MTLTYDQELARSVTEDELLTHVMDLLELYHFRAFHVRNSKAGVVQGDTGFPDVIACDGKRILAIELKREGKKPTPAQLAWLEAFRDAGAEAMIWTPSHYLSGRIGHVLGEP